jgi:hypothetical protein
MTGGLVQLVAKGIDNIYLTDDPEITLFKTIYRRHSNFSKIGNIIHNKIVPFGETYTCKIQHMGDLIHHMSLIIDIPKADMIFEYIQTVLYINNLLLPANITNWDHTGLTDSDLVTLEYYNNYKGRTGLYTLINNQMTTLNTEIDKYDALISIVDSHATSPDGGTGRQFLTTYYNDIMTGRNYESQYNYVNAYASDYKILYNQTYTFTPLDDIFYTSYFNYIQYEQLILLYKTLNNGYTNAIVVNNTSLVASAGDTTIRLALTSSSDSSQYVNWKIQLYNNTYTILSYVGSTKIATLTSALLENIPLNTKYTLYNNFMGGRIQSYDITTDIVKLDAFSNTTNNMYNNWIFNYNDQIITPIISYTGSTTDATIYNYDVNYTINDEMIYELYNEPYNYYSLAVATATTNTIQVTDTESLLSSVDSYYINWKIKVPTVTSGDSDLQTRGQNQIVKITAYNGTTKTFTITPNFFITPTDNDTCQIFRRVLFTPDILVVKSIAFYCPVDISVVSSSTGKTLIYLDSGASATDGIYDNKILEINYVAGTQNYLITKYIGSNKGCVISSSISLPTVGTTITVYENKTYIYLDAGASAVDDYYDTYTLRIHYVDGNEIYEIIKYTGATKCCSLYSFITLPPIGTVVEILENTCSIYLSSLASEIDNMYAGYTLDIYYDFSTYVERKILNYSGTTKCCTVASLIELPPVGMMVGIINGSSNVFTGTNVNSSETIIYTASITNSTHSSIYSGTVSDSAIGKVIFTTLNTTLSYQTDYYNTCHLKTLTQNYEINSFRDTDLTAISYVPTTTTNPTVGENCTLYYESPNYSGTFPDFGTNVGYCIFKTNIETTTGDALSKTPNFYENMTLILNYENKIYVPSNNIVTQFKISAYDVDNKKITFEDTNFLNSKYCKENIQQAIIDNQTNQQIPIYYGLNNEPFTSSQSMIGNTVKTYVLDRIQHQIQNIGLSTTNITNIDAYKICESYLNANGTTIISTSNLNLASLKTSLLSYIYWNLINNYLQYSSVLTAMSNNNINSLTATAEHFRFAFYKLCPRIQLLYDTTAIFQNMSSINQTADLNDNFTNVLKIIKDPNEPTTNIDYYPVFVSTTTNTMHSNNTLLINSNIFKDYYNNLNLWSVLNYTAWDTTLTPDQQDTFSNVYFLNLIPYALCINPSASRKDVRNAINAGLSNYLSYTYPATDFTSLTTDLLSKFDNTWIPAIMATLGNYLYLSASDKTYLTSIIDYNTKTINDIMLFYLFRPDEFFDLNGTMTDPLNYVLGKFSDYLTNHFDDSTTQAMAPIIKDWTAVIEVCNNILNSFRIASASLMTYNQYVSNNYRTYVDPYMTEVSATSPFIDAPACIFYNCFTTMYARYNTFFSSVYSKTYLEDSVGTEALDTFRLMSEILGIDLDSITDYYGTTINSTQLSMAKSNLLLKKNLMKNTLDTFIYGKNILNMQNIYLSPETYFFNKKQTGETAMRTIMESAKSSYYPIIGYNGTIPIYDDAYVNELMSLSFTMPYLDGVMDQYSKTSIGSFINSFYTSLDAVTNPFDETAQYNRWYWWNYYIKNKTTAQRDVIEADMDTIMSWITVGLLYDNIDNIFENYEYFWYVFDLAYFLADHIISSSTVELESVYYNLFGDLSGLIKNNSFQETWTEEKTLVKNYYTQLKTIPVGYLAYIHPMDGTFPSRLHATIYGLIAQTYPKFAWAEYYGYFLIETASISIDGQIINEHTGEWLYINRYLNEPSEHYTGIDKLIGNVSTMTTYDITEKPKRSIYIPLIFWFCKFSGSALPLVALQHAEILLHVKFKKLNEIAYWQSDSYPNSKLKLKCATGIEYIFIESSERQWFAEHKHECLIENVRYNGDTYINSNDVENYKFKQKINQPFSCKEIIWLAQSNYNVTSAVNHIPIYPYLYTFSYDDSITLENVYTQRFYRYDDQRIYIYDYIGSTKCCKILSLATPTAGLIVDIMELDDTLIISCSIYTATFNENINTYFIYLDRDDPNVSEINNTYTGKKMIIHFATYDATEIIYNYTGGTTGDSIKFCTIKGISLPEENDIVKILDSDTSILYSGSISDISYDTTNNYYLVYLDTDASTIDDAYTNKRIIISHLDYDTFDPPIIGAKYPRTVNVNGTIYTAGDLIKITLGASTNTTYKTISPIDSTKIQFNGQDREITKYSMMYESVYPFLRHTSTPPDGVNIYSFSLEPKMFQPSGAANLNEMVDVSLIFNINSTYVNSYINQYPLRLGIYVVCNNILRIMSGLGGLAYQ